MLVGHEVSGTVEEMKRAAKELSQIGSPYVLVKGGHVGGIPLF